MEKVLNHKLILQKTRRPLPDLDYSRFVNYDITSGVNVDIQCAYGLPS